MNHITYCGDTRLTRVQKNGESNLNWLFFPGGPGMGSEYLAPLTSRCALPGTLWHVDLPGEGSNRVAEPRYDEWFTAILQVIQSLKNVVAIGHSSGGMLLQATAGLEAHLVGLVLMDSAPDTSWCSAFAKYVQQHPLAKLIPLKERYAQQPSDELLREMTIAALPYYLAAPTATVDMSWLQHLPYNHAAEQWANHHFDNTYQAAWLPLRIPALILAGAEDAITPEWLFSVHPEYRRPNITLISIPAAGHFPWIENYSAVHEALQKFAQQLPS